MQEKDEEKIDDGENPGRITPIHLLCAMNFNFGLLSVYCQRK